MSTTVVQSEPMNGISRRDSLRSLRILVAQNVPHNTRGGMSRMLGFLHQRVVQDGHRVEFHTSDDIPPHLNRRLGRFVFPWKVWRRAVMEAKAGRPFDVINIHEPSGAVVAFGRRAAGNPALIVTSHGVEERGWEVRKEDSRLGRNPLRLRTRVLHPLTQLLPARISLRSADHVCCLNEEDRRFLLRRYNLDDNRVTRLAPGASEPYFDVFPRRDYFPQERILVFGTWIPRKGLIEIIKAFTVLADRRPKLKLLLLGTGFSSEYVAASFPEQLRSRLEFGPSGTESELAEWMLRADTYWLPSKFEGTPQTLLECMATGLPAITTATCGMKDVVADGVNGILIPVRNADALTAATEKLLDNVAFRERLGRQAHADVAEKYTWDRVVEPLRAIYNRIAEVRGSVGAR